MSNYKIEKGICIKIKRCSYPLGDMVPGDSFLVPFPEADRSAIASAVSYYGTRHPEKAVRFSVRKEEGGMRVFCLDKEAKP